MFVRGEEPVIVHTLPGLDPETPLSLTASAKAVGVHPGSIRAALLRGELKGYCSECHGGISVEIARGQKPHRCPKVSARKYRIYLKARDLARYSPNPWAQENGRKRVKKLALPSA